MPIDDEEIEREVRQFAASRNVVPLAAKERGSRMIGVEHEESDWDVFLLFVQEAEEYAKLGGYTDTVEGKVSGKDIDIHGWNVKKFAKLLMDSNPNAVEYLMSDKEYFRDVDFAFDKMATDAELNFNHMALYHHYLSLAKNNYRKYVESGNDCTYNRQFYVMRATCMAKHIRIGGSFPKLDVWDFLAQTDVLDEDEESLLYELSEKKSHGILGEAPDLVGEVLERENEVFMDPTNERTLHPNRASANDLIESALDITR